MWDSRRAICTCALALGCFIFVANVASGADATTATQPDGRMAGPGSLLDPIGIVQRLQNEIEQLELRPEQKARLEEVLGKAMQDAQGLEQEVRDLRPMERLQKLQPFITGLRQQLAELLGPRELQLMRQHATTQPFGGGVLPGAPGGRGGPGAPQAEMQRLRNSLDQLDLSADQKKQVTEALAAAQQKLQQLRQNPGAAGPGAGAQILMDLRQEMRDVLTPDQLEKVRQKMGPPGGGGPNDPATQAPNRRAAKTAAGDGTSAAASWKSAPTTHPTVGMDAPEFHLQSLGGAMVDLDKLHGRVVVLEFGSGSSPTFRDHVAAMEKLYQLYGSRCSMMIVYTHEAHPAEASGVTDQNDGITIPQAADFSGRRSAAEKMHTALHVTIPILIDGMDDAVTDGYGGFPNATVVIGKEGKIVGRQQWNDPSGLGRIMYVALGASAPASALGNESN